METVIAANVSYGWAVDTSVDAGDEENDDVDEVLMKLSRVRQNFDEISSFIIYAADDEYQSFYDHSREFCTWIILKQQLKCDYKQKLGSPSL